MTERTTALVLLAALFAGCAKPSSSAPPAAPPVNDRADGPKQPPGAEPKPVEPSGQWWGEVGSLELEKLAPESGVITTRADFEKVWSAWWRFGKTPDVDFKTSFAAVRTWSPRQGKIAAGTSGVKISGLRVSADGSATVVQAPYLWSPERGEKWEETPGFYFGLAVFPRAGIKQVDGKELR